MASWTNPCGDCARANAQRPMIRKRVGFHIPTTWLSPPVYRKRNGMAEAIPFQSEQFRDLEVELHSKLNDALTLLDSSLAEIRIRLRKRVTLCRILHEI